MYYTSHLTNIPSNEHMMLLYASDDERNNAAVKYINNGLDISAFMRLSTHMIVKVAPIFQIYLQKLIIIKKISKPENYKLLILSLIINQYCMEIISF